MASHVSCCCVSRYGDWCSVADGAATSCQFMRADISTFYFLTELRIITDFATRLGHVSDATRYSSFADTIAERYNGLWYHSDAAYYQDGYPISQILALQAGVAGSNDAAVFNTLVSLINNGSHSGYPTAPTGGIVYTKYVWPVLTARDKLDLALQLMLARGMPSYDYWIEGSGPNTGVAAAAAVVVVDFVALPWWAALSSGRTQELTACWVALLVVPRMLQVPQRCGRTGSPLTSCHTAPTTTSCLVAAATGCTPCWAA